MPADHVHFNGSVNLGDAESGDARDRRAGPVRAAAHPGRPQYQREESYFAPLAGLTRSPDTELNFALVPYHPAEQAAGTTGDQVRLIDAALAASPGGRRDWGICTECGMGRVDRDDVPALLDLHREIITAP